MKTFLKILASILLLFNGTGAIYGGLSLMIHPDGSGILLSPAWLEHTPFYNYFIPGLILFIVNGLFSIFVLITLLFNYRNYAWLVMVQGAILTGWIIIQVILIQTIYYLHIVLGLTGILLMIFGMLQRRMNKEEIK